MGLTGRYDLKGIQRTAGLAIDSVLAGTVWGAWLLASPLRFIAARLRDALINYLANRGIIMINVGVNIVDGVIDQKRLDAAIDDGIRRVTQGRDKITPAEGKAIDDKVREAFDESADLGASGDGL